MHRLIQLHCSLTVQTNKCIKANLGACITDHISCLLTGHFLCVAHNLLIDKCSSNAGVFLVHWKMETLYQCPILGTEAELEMFLESRKFTALTISVPGNQHSLPRVNWLRWKIPPNSPVCAVDGRGGLCELSLLRHWDGGHFDNYDKFSVVLLDTHPVFYYTFQKLIFANFVCEFTISELLRHFIMSSDETNIVWHYVYKWHFQSWEIKGKFPSPHFSPWQISLHPCEPLHWMTYFVVKTKKTNISALHVFV